MQFFKYSMRTNSPTGIDLGLPSNFARSKVMPACVPLPNVGVAAGGRRWVDLMVTNTSVFLYSEAVVRMVEEEGFRGIEFFPVEIGEIESKLLRAQTPWPRYYVGRTTGRIGAVVTTDEGAAPPFDEATGTYRRRGASLYRGQLLPETWDGSDFFYISSFPSYCFCTARVKAAIEQRKLYNFNFYSEHEPNVFTV